MMHKVGIGSLGIVKQGNIEDGYRMIKEAGIDCVDFNMDEFLFCNDVYENKINDVFDRPFEEIWEDFRPHAEAAAKYGLTFDQMHAPFPVKVKGRDDINEKLFRIMVNSLELCARMGGHYIVVHPVTLAYECSRQEEYDFNIAMYKELIPTAKHLNLVICLENMFLEINQHLMEGVCSDFRDAAAMIDELNEAAGEELFAFCFDIGHANVLGKNLYQSVVMLGDRLQTLHIHDNDGISDLHTLPYTFMRGWNGLSTDWDGFLRGLREIGYRGVINFETSRCVEAFPEELRPSLLKLHADMGRYFSRQIDA